MTTKRVFITVISTVQMCIRDRVFTILFFEFKSRNIYFRLLYSLYYLWSKNATLFTKVLHLERQIYVKVTLKVFLVARMLACNAVLLSHTDKSVDIVGSNILYTAKQTCNKRNVSLKLHCFHSVVRCDKVCTYCQLSLIHI